MRVRYVAHRGVAIELAKTSSLSVLSTLRRPPAWSASRKANLAVTHAAQISNSLQLPERDQMGNAFRVENIRHVLDLLSEIDHRQADDHCHLSRLSFRVRHQRRIDTSKFFGG